MITRKLSLRFVICAALTLYTAIASAWPEREINLTVMYGAGGNTDMIAREVASKLSDELGQTVVVHNRPGGQGTVGPAWVSRQRPDDYNLGIVTGSSIALAPHINKAGYTPSDFTYIGAFAMPRFGVAVHNDAPYSNMQDLMEDAKKKETFIASGAVLNSLLLMELNSTDGTKFTVVPYKSGAEVTNALLGKHVDVIVSNPPDILPHVQSGSMRLLASGSPFRWSDLPDTPTLGELNLGSGNASSWIGIAGPKNMPIDVTQKLSEALSKVANNSEFQTRIAALGADAINESGEELEAYMLDRYSTWLDALKQTNLLPQN